jgi:hypothetical protein
MQAAQVALTFPLLLPFPLAPQTLVDQLRLPL